MQGWLNEYKDSSSEEDKTDMENWAFFLLNWASQVAVVVKNPPANAE